MTMSSRGGTRINFLILLVSAIAWVMLLVNPGSIMTLAHCPVTDSGASRASFQMLLAMTAPRRGARRQVNVNLQRRIWHPSWVRPN